MSFETNELRWLTMADPKVKKSKEKDVHERVRSGRCLLCDSTDNNRRGLCQAHYQAFLRFINSLPKKDRRAEENRQIHEGTILANGQLREIRNPNPFAAVN